MENGGAGDDPTPAQQRSAEIDRLAHLAAAGNTRALNELLRAIEPEVGARCRRILPNAHDAEEAAQDTLLNVARHISTFEGRSKFTSWLYRVATTSALQTYRSLKRRAHDVQFDALPESARSGPALSVLVGTRLDFIEASNAVDDDFSIPVLLRDVQRLDYKEIAAILDIPEGTVKSRISTGRQRIRERMITD